MSLFRIIFASGNGREVASLGFALGSLWVRSGFALPSLWVRSYEWRQREAKKG